MRTVGDSCGRAFGAQLNRGVNARSSVRPERALSADTKDRKPSNAAIEDAGGPECGLQLLGTAMETRKLRVGQSITPEEFEALSDEQLVRLVPRAYREYFPGKDFCADGCFYLHDGTAWSFFKAGFFDE